MFWIGLIIKHRVYHKDWIVAVLVGLGYVGKHLSREQHALILKWTTAYWPNPPHPRLTIIVPRLAQPNSYEGNSGLIARAGHLRAFHDSQRFVCPAWMTIPRALYLHLTLRSKSKCVVTYDAEVAARAEATTNALLVGLVAERFCVVSSTKRGKWSGKAYACSRTILSSVDWISQSAGG